MVARVQLGAGIGLNLHDAAEVVADGAVAGSGAAGEVLVPVQGGVEGGAAAVGGGVVEESVHAALLLAVARGREADERDGVDAGAVLVHVDLLALLETGIGA